MLEKLKELKEILEHLSFTNIEDKNNIEKAHNLAIELIEEVKEEDE